MAHLKRFPLSYHSPILHKRDFIEPGGFGEKLGNDVSKLQKAIPPCKKVLQVAREAGLLVIHTREGHRADLTDLHPHKASHGKCKPVIGAEGPYGRVLIRGEPGHDIISELYPEAGEPVVDKPVREKFCKEKYSSAG